MQVKPHSALVPSNCLDVGYGSVNNISIFFYVYTGR